MQIKPRLLIILLLIASCNYVSAQYNEKLIRTDSILVKKGSRVTHGNKSFIPKKDTVIIVTDSSFFRVRIDPKLRSNVFFDSLESKADRSKFTKGLYDMAFISQNRNRKDTVITMKSDAPFIEYEGKIIRSIRIKRLDVFGTSLNDTMQKTLRGFVRFLNAVHYNSREWVIKHNVHLKTGDRINSLIVAENERILRELPYIEDALISITEPEDGSDSVDVVVITKDVWSISVVPIVKSSTSATFRISDANMLGLGHRFSNKIAINTNQQPVVIYKQFSYETQNIAGSFISGIVEYTNDPEENTYTIGTSRTFMPPLLKVAGGLRYMRTDRNIIVLAYSPDTMVVPGKLKYDAVSAWGGKTFPLNIFVKENQNKTYFTLSGSYSRYTYLEHPQYNDEKKYNYENRDIILCNTSVSKNNYYLTNLIYSFGKTEDVPYGYNITYTFGEKFGNYGNMFYSGLKLSYGTLIPNAGFLFASSEYGGYISAGSINQGVFGTGCTYVTKLSDIIGSQLRNFFSLKYLKGINRYNYEKIYLDSDNGFRGVGKNEDLTGIQRLTINMESVLFTPIYFLGFRFAAFGYIDNGFITYNDKIISTSNYYMGLGLGVRIRNENLIFKTFKVDFSFYPIAPNNIKPAYFTIKSVDSAHPENFNPTAPRLVSFE